MNINTTLNYSNQDSGLQSRPVQHVDFNSRQQGNKDTTSLSDYAKQLQQSEQREKSLIESLETSNLHDENLSSDENIRVSSTIGRQISSGNLTRDEALDIYRSIQNLL